MFKKSNLKYEIMKVKLHRTVQNITYYTLCQHTVKVTLT